MEVPKSIKTGMALVMTAGVAANAAPAVAHPETPNQPAPTPAEAMPIPAEQDPNFKVCRELGAVGAASWLIPFKNPRVVAVDLDVKNVDNKLCDHIANREQISWDIVSRSPRTKRLTRISRGIIKFFGEDGAHIKRKLRVKDCAPKQKTRRVSLRQRVATRTHDNKKLTKTKVAPTVKQYC